VKRTVAALLLLVATASPHAAAAHALDPALLDLRELPDGTTSVAWRSSALRLAGARPMPVLPPTCRPVQPVETTEDGASVVMRWTVDCRPDGLVGRQLGVEGLGPARIDALVRVALADGRVVRAVARAREPMITVPARPSRLAVLRDYVRLGVEHILTGPDHLLFVFGLLLLVGTPRLLIATATAFTLGHSLTLTAAVLDIVRVPSGPAELMIALTVFVLACELARDAVRPTLMRQFPWAMAGVFGLLHGLGFAGALREVGLPDGDIPLALFSFNVGVEVGQIAFIVVVLALRAGLRRLPARWPRWAEWVPVYGMGTLAAFWCFQRAAALVR
jgi:hydrogenase/urease accessory protein HupE